MRWGMRAPVERVIAAMSAADRAGLRVDGWPRLFHVTDSLARMVPIPAGTVVDPLSLGAHRGEWIRAAGVPHSDRAVLHCHGGGYFAGGLNTHRRMAAQLSHAAQAPVLSIHYDLLPDGTVAQAVDAALAGYARLRDLGFRDDQIVVSGDSCGGQIAIAAILALRDEQGATPAAFVGMAPIVDYDHAAKRAHPNKKRDPMVPGNGFWMFDRMLGPELTHTLSPINADLSALPPTLLHYGSTEVLLADGERFAHKLAESGVATRLKIWDHQFHVFQLAADFLPEGRQSIDEIGRFIVETTNPSADGETP